jgi:hypothetical protein
MGEFCEFFTINLPKLEDSVIFISSEFNRGCPKCNSSLTALRMI